MFRSTNPEQTYVSLIHENSNYYASWDPARLVRVGDYGHLQADGSFATEGNIFNEGWAAEFGIEEIRGPTDSIRCIQSSDVQEVRETATGSIGTSWIHKVTTKKTFVVKRSYGAILIMLEPRYTQLSPSGTLKDLVYSTAFKKHHLLVSELYSCASYARLLAPKQEHVVNISLEGEAHQDLVRGKEEAEWQHTADGGDFKCGVQQGADVAFTPLFRLVGRKASRFRKLPTTELARPTWRRVVAAAGPQSRGPSSSRSDDIEDDYESEPEYEEVQRR